MRVVLLGGGVHPIPPTGYGAVERILADYATALRAAGVEVRIVNQVRRRRTRDEIPFALALPRLLRDERYDVLHANTPVVANRLALGGYPFVYTSHSRHWFYRRGPTHRWGYWLERRAVHRAAAVVALTERLARAMREAVRPPLPPLDVIPFGVDLARFRPDWSRRTGRRALGVGVVAPFKRWHLAARALRGTGISLRIAGPIASPSYAADIRAAGDAVELLGEVEDAAIAGLYAESDLLVHPSEVEVLSATVLEALSAGLPVLGGPPVEGVVDDGRTGWSVPDADLAAFVEQLRGHAVDLAASDDRRRAMGDAARTSAEQRYAWPTVVARHLALYARAGAAVN